MHDEDGDAVVLRDERGRLHREGQEAEQNGAGQPAHCEKGGVLRAVGQLARPDVLEVKLKITRGGAKPQQKNKKRRDEAKRKHARRETREDENSLSFFSDL